MISTESQEFRDFLVFVAKSGYADANAKVTDLQDGSHDLVIQRGSLQFHDNWFGGEPFGGLEVVSDGGKVFWMMTYFGAVDDSEATNNVYSALKEAMKQPDENMPIRGPKHMVASNGYEYSFDWQGNLDRFTGVEVIRNPQGKIAYQTEVSGGLVDQ